MSSNTHDPVSTNVARRRGVVAVVARGEQLLVIRRSAHVVAPRAFCFPGGAIEADESEEQALAREIREELGVILRPIRRIWSSVTPWQVDLAWWLGDLGVDAVFQPNGAEVESIHWLTPREMLALDDLLPSNRDFLHALQAGRMTVRLPRPRDRGDSDPAVWHPD